MGSKVACNEVFYTKCKLKKRKFGKSCCVEHIKTGFQTIFSVDRLGFVEPS